MKNIVNILVSGVALIALNACATQPDGLSVKPVVKTGTDTSLNPKQYVQLIPAGSNIPFYVSIKGDTFKKEVKENIPLILKHDLYLYGNTTTNETIWVSHDRKHWYTVDEAFKGEMSFTLEHTNKGSSVNFSLKADRRKENSK